jgi:hypothetical protein
MEFHAELRIIDIGIWEIWSDLYRIATASLFWIPCSRCNMQYGFSIKDLASEAKVAREELGWDAA